MIYNNFTSVQIVLILRFVLDIHYAGYRLKMLPRTQSRRICFWLSLYKKKVYFNFNHLDNDFANHILYANMNKSWFTYVNWKSKTLSVICSRLPMNNGHFCHRLQTTLFVYNYLNYLRKNLVSNVISYCQIATDIVQEGKRIAQVILKGKCLLLFQIRKWNNVVTQTFKREIYL
jgi:hypothetical protein